DRLCTISLINSTISLYHSYRNLHELRKAEDDKVQKLVIELSDYQRKCAKLSSENAKQSRALSEAGRKEAKLQQSIKDLETSLRREKEERKRTKTEGQSRVQYLETAYRRIQAEHEKLSNRIKKTHRIVPPNMEVSSVIPLPESHVRRKWPEEEQKKLQEEKWMLSVQSLNRKLQSISQHTERLTTVLINLGRTLFELVKFGQDRLKCELGQKDNHVISEDEAFLSVDIQEFPVDFDLHEERSTNFFNELLVRLKKIISYSFCEERLRDLPLVNQLKDELEKLQFLIDVKEKIIINLTTSDAGLLEDVDILQGKETLKKELKIVKDKKYALENERKVYTEGLLRLIKEKAEFERDRNEALRQYFLAQTPPVRKAKTRTPGGDFLPSVPLRPSEEREKLNPLPIATPSTPELYLELGLDYKSSDAASSGWTARGNPNLSTKIRKKLFKENSTNGQDRNETFTKYSDEEEDLDSNIDGQRTANEENGQSNLFVSLYHTPCLLAESIQRASVSASNENHSESTAIYDEFIVNNVPKEERKKSCFKLVREDTVIKLENDESDGYIRGESPSPIVVPPLVDHTESQSLSKSQFTNVQNVSRESNSFTVKTSAVYYQAQNVRASTPNMSIVTIINDAHNTSVSDSID
ncbi:hypothetical protein QYM36_001291, partial [Artemia franciscana]